MDKFDHNTPKNRKVLLKGSEPYLNFDISQKISSAIDSHKIERHHHEKLPVEFYGASSNIDFVADGVRRLTNKFIKNAYLLGESLCVGDIKVKLHRSCAFSINDQTQAISATVYVADRLEDYGLKRISLIIDRGECVRSIHSLAENTRCNFQVSGQDIPDIYWDIEDAPETITMDRPRLITSEM